MSKRKQYKPEFKAKVALEALEGERTASELASRFGVDPPMEASTAGGCRGAVRARLLDEKLAIMVEIDRQFLDTPFYGCGR